jgi:hypothetical protein
MEFKKIIFSILAFCFVALPAMGVLAADSCTIDTTQGWYQALETKGYNCSANCDYSSYSNDCGTCCMINTIYNITNWAFFIIVAFSVLMIIWGGVTFMQSQGEPEKTGKAKQMILYAAVGIIVAVLAKAVPGIVLSLI